MTAHAEVRTGTGFRREVAGRHITVAGLGTSGLSAARALADLGARVTVVDGGDGAQHRERAAQLRKDGIDVRLGDGRTLPEGTSLVVTSPGWQPDGPLFAAAASAGVDVIGDVELAWRLRGPQAAPWLAVTGTNGKTTTVRMLAAMLAAAGLRTAAVGNIGTPLVDVVLSDERSDRPHQVLVVELSSYQLHWATSVRPHAAAVLNIAPDHLDWHGSMAAYAADKGRIYQVAARPGAGGPASARGPGACCVYNVADPATEQLVRAAEAEQGARSVGFTLQPPARGQLGVADGLLVDRAFATPDDGADNGAFATPDDGAERRADDAAGPARAVPVRRERTDGVVLAAVTDIGPPAEASAAAPAPHNVANALAAAALARAWGVPPEAVRDGLRGFRPDAHRNTPVDRVDGVAYIDDSKATNTHATEASLAAYDPVVWIAGGLAKGAVFDELAARAAERLRGVVLIGADRGLIREALARHAPDVPVVDVERTDTGAMAAAVREAACLARPGDTVLLAPACASMDMFVNYNERGDLFAAAVRALASGRSATGG